MNVNNVKGRITSEVANNGNFRYYSKNLTGIHPCFTQKTPTIYLKKKQKSKQLENREFLIPQIT